jgi:SNF2 family DNA or RNA helicase
MELVEDTAVRMALPWESAEEVLSVIQRSELVVKEDGKADIVVCWDYDEMAWLAQYFDQKDMEHAALPSPMLRDYNWPGMFRPFEHQKTTASYLSLRQRAFCFNEAGTGKTSAAIWAADYLMKLGLVKRVLVICPLSIMYAAWQADLFKTVMSRSVAVAHGDKAKRAKIIQGDYEFVIINFDGVGVVMNEIAAGGFDLIIVDEANAYKTATTQRWRRLSKLIKPTTRLWMMTGTPASQSPIDAFGLARLVSPQRVPKFVTAWRDKVMVQITRFKWMPKLTARQMVFDALQPAIRFSKAECLDLPEVMYQTRDVPMSPQAAKYYRTLKQQLQMEAAGEQVSAVNAAAALSKLLQIAGGAVYTDKKDVVEFDIKPRLNELKDVLDETINKVIVFVPYNHTITVVHENLTAAGYSSEIINGDVPARARAEIIDRFQKQENPRVLVIQPQAASHGITLTAADTIVFWSPVMSVETYLQCIGRIDRVGQKNSMTVVHLQGSEVEKKVYSMLQNKVDSHNKLVDLYKRELESDE